MESAGKVLQKIKGLRTKIEKYNELYASWEDLYTLVMLAIEEGDESVLDEVKTSFKTLKDNLETMQLETLLSGKYDKNNAILTLHAGLAEQRRRTGAKCFIACILTGQTAVVLRQKLLITWQVMRQV